MIESIPVRRKFRHFLRDRNTDSTLNNFKSVHVDEERRAMIWHFSLAH